MTRRLLNLLTALCLLLCVAGCVLWWRSHRGEDRVSHCVRGTRYSVTSAAGRLVLYAPPRPAARPEARRAAEAAAAALRNDQVCWGVFFDRWSPDDPYPVDDEPSPLLDTPASELWFLEPGDTAGPLLAALEDPGRFVAAHALLWLNYAPRTDSLPSRVVAGRFLAGTAGRSFHGFPYANVPWIGADHDGLSITLTRWAGPGTTPGMGKDLEEHGLLAEADPAQLPRVRDRWHRRLDVPVNSVAWRYVLVVAALPPALRLAGAVWRRAARSAALRRNRCLRCGYDLRATRDRCPECGMPATWR